jgi:SOS-response transcriptional repressor LexA
VKKSHNTEKVLAFIEGRSEQRLPPPTLREISTHFGWNSSRAAGYHVELLERAGKIRKGTFGSARSIEVAASPTKGYRLDLRLPREHSMKIEKLRVDMQKLTGERVTKSKIVLLIIEKFLERVSD